MYTYIYIYIYIYIYMCVCVCVCVCVYVFASWKRLRQKGKGRERMILAKINQLDLIASTPILIFSEHVSNNDNYISLSFFRNSCSCFFFQLFIYWRKCLYLQKVYFVSRIIFDEYMIRISLLNKIKNAPMDIRENVVIDSKV